MPLTNLGGHAFPSAGVCPKCQESLLARVATMFLCASATLAPDRRLALNSYVTNSGQRYEADANRVVLRQDGGPVLTATFDEHNRLTKLDVEVRPTPAPPVESWDELMLQLALRG